MPLRDQLRFWVLAGLAFILLVWVFSDILLPFVLGMAFAYLLDPAVEALTQRRLPRWVSVLIVLSAAVLFGLVVMLMITPIIWHQVSLLAERWPSYTAQAQKLYADWRMSAPFGMSPERFDQAVAELLKALRSGSQAQTGAFVQQGLQLLNLASLVFISPVVAYYLLLDWSEVKATVLSWLPRPYETTILSLISDMDGCLAGFVRGQVLVCGIQAAFYAVGLSLAGLEYGLIIGVLSGVLSFVPIVGAAIGFLLCMMVGLFQFWGDWPMIAAITAIFVSGQMLEANYLTPKLVGNRVGLHPIWIIFALLAFGSLFGFLGLLLAVPVAAAIGVLTRFALEQYLKSPYYLGSTQRALQIGGDVQ